MNVMKHFQLLPFSHQLSPLPDREVLPLLIFCDVPVQNIGARISNQCFVRYPLWIQEIQLVFRSFVKTCQEVGGIMRPRKIL